jgi:two-component system chemotaxis response regulator CheY
MNPTILIADDASFIREILKNIASQQGWQVVGEAIDGQEAIAKALALRPDIVIMDIVMPKFNGIEAAKAILKSEPSLAIIGLSTMNDETIMARAIEAGFVSYITKPFANGSIIAAVREASIKKERKIG